MAKLKTPEDYDAEIKRLRMAKAKLENQVIFDAGKILHKIGLTSLSKPELAGALSQIAEKLGSSESETIKTEWAERGKSFRF